MRTNDPLRPCFGIDLGTSNTEISILRDGEVTTLPIAQHRSMNGTVLVRSRRMPSLVYYAEDGSRRFGEVFRLYQQDMPYYEKRVVTNTKRMLLLDPDEPVGYYMHNNKKIQVNPREVAQALLEKCFEAAKTAGYQPGDPVMLTVPCAYQMDQIHATLDAARAAGFAIPSNVELITEPVAALIEYISSQDDNVPHDSPQYLDLEKPANVLVYDLGGGTLDLALVRIEKTEDGFCFTELSNNDSDLTRAIGGADFDAAAAKYFLQEILRIEAQKRNITVAEMKAKLGNQMDIIEEQVHALAYSFKERFSKGMPYDQLLPIVLEDEVQDDLDDESIYFTLNGDVGYKYEIGYLNSVKDFLNPNTDKNILSRIRSVLENAYYFDNSRVPLRDVHKILVTGGMTRFQPVMDALKTYLENESQYSEKPFHLDILTSSAGLEAVSKGAAYSHQLIIENRRTYRPKHYFLEVDKGLPFDLENRNSTQIALPNPNEVLLNIYCGTTRSDPDMRLMYTYRSHFTPRLQLPAILNFSFHLEQTGEGVLEGHVRDDSGRKEHIRFSKAWRDQKGIQMSGGQNRNAVNRNQILGKISDAFRLPLQKDHKHDSVIYGIKSVDPHPENAKRLFLNIKNTNSDKSNVLAQAYFEQSLRMMDLRNDGKPIVMRFNELIKLLESHYQAGNPHLEIPVLQYILYSLRQLPLGQLKIPSYPPRPEEQDNLIEEDLVDIADGIYDLCETVADLYCNGSDEVKQMFKKELIHCIDTWNWSDIFQVILSIAQHVGSFEWAAMLHNRVADWGNRRRTLRGNSMGKPDKHTPNRLAQAYLNYLDNGGDTTADFCSAVECLFRDRFEYGDPNWFKCDLVRSLLRKLPKDTADRICLNDKRLREVLKKPDPSTIQVPDDLKPFLYRMPRDPEEKKMVWDKVHEFLTDEKTKWPMMYVLADFGRAYDDETARLILEMPKPEKQSQQKVWIRTLGCIRSKASAAVLEKMWRSCALHRKYIMVLDKRSMEENVIPQMEKAENWLTDASFVKTILEDNSLDLLASMSFVRDQDRFRRLSMISALIAAVPVSWMKGEELEKRLWRHLCKAVHAMWTNLRKDEQKDLKSAVSVALKQLTYLSVCHANYIPHLDRALHNFCLLFEHGITLRKIYHPELVTHLVKLFNTCETCPLSVDTQIRFIKFLNQHYTDPDIQARKSRYAEFLILWCQTTEGPAYRFLVNAPVFRDIVGIIPKRKD